MHYVTFEFIYHQVTNKILNMCVCGGVAEDGGVIWEFDK